MVVRRVFHSFHYQKDAWRAAQVRYIGAIEHHKPASANEWEEVKRGGDAAIERWIDRQLENRTCTIVLVGEETSRRKWVKYEINRSWEKGLGVVGIYIHGLKDRDGKTSRKGQCPLNLNLMKCYDPPGSNSQKVYDWISKNLANAIEEAIAIRKKYQ